MPCDETDTCPYPGEPGYAGALEPEHVELGELYLRYKRLGTWALPASRNITDAQHAELVHVLYELELENARLKQAHPEVRFIWDAEAGG